jgi:hypothetical protein
MIGWPLARKYRDVFERIKEVVLDIIARGKNQTRQHIPRRVERQFAGLEEGILGNASQNLEQMIGDMIGDPGDVASFEDFDFQGMATRSD